MNYSSNIYDQRRQKSKFHYFDTVDHALICPPFKEIGDKTFMKNYFSSQEYIISRVIVTYCYGSDECYDR